MFWHQKKQIDEKRNAFQNLFLEWEQCGKIQQHAACGV